MLNLSATFPNHIRIRSTSGFATALLTNHKQQEVLLSVELPLSVCNQTTDKQQRDSWNENCVLCY